MLALTIPTLSGQFPDRFWRFRILRQGVLSLEMFVKDGVLEEVHLYGILYI